MENLPPPRLSGTTNELAKERNRAAAERTINAWIGSCLGLMGTGIAFDQITASLQRQFPTAAAPLTIRAAHLIGLFLVGTGVFLLGLALMQHHFAITAIQRPDYTLSSISVLNRVVVAAIVLFGFASLVIILGSFQLPLLGGLAVVFAS